MEYNMVNTERRIVSRETISAGGSLTLAARGAAG
jgi:hypothetical protein